MIGYSVERRPITAYRFGSGPYQVALVGDIHGGYEANTRQLLLELKTHFEAHPEDVPPTVTLWLIPVANPDSLAQDRRFNARGVDLNRNTDTDLDGCAGNDWQPDTFTSDGQHRGAGGAYPFSEPETRALADFLKQTHIVVSYHSYAGAIFPGGCGTHGPTLRLAQVLAEATGYDVPAEGWTAYPSTGGLADYLTDLGVAAVTLELTDEEHTELDRNLRGVLAVLNNVEDIVTARLPQALGQAHWLGLDKGAWTAYHYGIGAFPHPLSPVMMDGTLYFLDGGQLKALIPGVAEPPRTIVPPEGDETHIQELLDLTALPDSSALILLDRDGEVYRYTPATDNWAQENWAQLSGSSSHYLTAVAADKEAIYLLDTNSGRVWRYIPGAEARVIVEIPRSRGIDLAADGRNLYVLLRETANERPAILQLNARTGEPGWTVKKGLDYPTALWLTPQPNGPLYVLDSNDRRLLALDRASGAVLDEYLLLDREVTLRGGWPLDERLLFVAPDAVYLYPAAAGETGFHLPDPDQEVFDPNDLERLRGFIPPIAGIKLPERENSLPGAPRYYRYGVHQGIDLYAWPDGTQVTTNTEVLAARDGLVIRADWDYEEPTPSQMNAWLAECRQRGYTPEGILDHLRGRQVWLDHGHGIVTRYVHLSAIAKGVKVGQEVQQGQVIGYVGNSGTPESLYNADAELHLHFEIWIGEHYLGQYLSPIETRRWLNRVIRW
ncbi:MAG: peptidoglycan DD-metalloendopeptidase family protein [Anaerolineae bacterium]|nr:peptidoglycan DD-metalloendopeptidase family protein [Anaerolineae bacterium]